MHRKLYILLFFLITGVFSYAQNCHVVSVAYNPNAPLLWSPDSSMYVVNQQDTAGVFQLYIGTKHSSTLTCISDVGPQHWYRPWYELNKLQVRWDPSGKYLVCGVEKEFYNELLYTPYSLRLDWLESGVWMNIWAVTPDGKKWYELDSTIHGFTGVAFTPDGKKGAWAQMLDTSETNESFGVWWLELSTYDTTGGPHFSSTLNITPPGAKWVEPGDFSPINGNLLLFNSDIGLKDPQGQDQYILDISTGKVTNLTKSPKVWDEHGVFSPDGKKVLLMSSYPYRYDTNTYHTLSLKTEFILIDPDTIKGPYSGVEQLTHYDTTGYVESDSGIAATGFFTPDGIKIYAQSLLAPRYANWIITFDGPCGDSVMSVDEINDPDGFTLYPDPANNYIAVKWENNNRKTEYSIYNVMGEKIMDDYSNNSSSFRININNYPEGIYFIWITDGLNTISRKFIITR